MSVRDEYEHTQDKGNQSAIDWDRPLTRRDLLRYGGMLGFGAVGAGLLASCTAVADSTFTQSQSPTDLPAAKTKYLAIIVVDGCRADYIDPKLALPNLRHLTQSGTYFTNAWSGSMESITPACHAALGTGRFAKNNGGILGFWWENPVTHAYGESVNLANSLTTTRPGDGAAIDPTSLEQILQANKIPTMASYLKGVDPRAKVYAGAGAKFYAADAAGGPDADFITYLWNDGANYYHGLNIGGPNHRPIPQEILDSVSHRDYEYANYGDRYVTGPKTGEYVLGSNGKPLFPQHVGESDAMVAELAYKVIKRERPRLVFLNLGNMDWPYGHLNGGILSPQYWQRVITNVDAGLGRIMQAYRDLGVFDQTTFVFLGDHGMVPVEQQVDKPEVLSAISAAGASVSGADFHTGGFIWLTNPDQALKVATYLDDAIEAGNLPGVIGVYFRGEAGGRPQFLPSPVTAKTLVPASDRAYRYLLETLNGANAPNVVLIFQEWTGITGAGGPNQQWYGDHGGASWSSHWVPLIMSGPGIRKGHVSKFPARLVDIAPTGLRLMGVPYGDVDGVVLADVLTQPSRSEVSAQQVASTQLVPIVAAMTAQANRDVAHINAYGRQNPPPGSPGLPKSNSNQTRY